MQGSHTAISISKCRQITELLAEVRPKKKPLLDTFLHTMKSILSSIKSSEPMSVSICKCCYRTSTISFLQLYNALTCLPKHVKYPLRLNCGSHIKGNFCLAPPHSVKMVGSYLLQSLTKPELNVDVAVEIPRVSCDVGIN